ncbi:uncharacterized protein LOC124367767 [Homalodisca vitripennis]|uniref:uncharacterized protein LOC124367767 n=1 Tax=Homalodisca vitripennis TaxID=197043 RepID=UPI001EECB410|nr:uncharacterized protein LOC124367767 [Homalodisca vitripennis]
MGGGGGSRRGSLHSTEQFSVPGTPLQSEDLARMPPTPSTTEESTTDSSLPWENSTMSDILSTLLPANSSAESTVSPMEEQNLKKLHEFQIIKAVVLATVTVIIMFSVCKMVFQLFIRYSGKQDDR